VLRCDDGERDLEAIEAVAGASPRTSRHRERERFTQLRDALRARGVSREALEGLLRPRLDIAARSPEEIAPSASWPRS